MFGKKKKKEEKVKPPKETSSDRTGGNIQKENLKVSIVEENYKFARRYWFWIFILLAITWAFVPIFYFYQGFIHSRIEGKLSEALDTLSKRVLLVTTDGRLVDYNPQAISPEVALKILKSFIAKEMIFSEENVWYVYPPKPYPKNVDEFIEKSPLLSKWEKYYITPQAKLQLYYLANFLLAKGELNELPEHEYPIEISFSNPKIRGNEFQIKGTVKLGLVFLDMKSGYWLQGTGEEDFTISGYFDFKYADPVYNPYGIKIKSLTVSLPLK